MTPPRRNTPKQEAAFLRAEGRFAVMAGGLLMALGFALAIALGLVSLHGDLAGWIPAAFAVAPVVLGWAALMYGAWRFEQALAVKRGARPPKLHLRASAMRFRVGKRPHAAKPAAQPEDQAHWKL
jgi:hypothetical protein